MLPEAQQNIIRDHPSVVSLYDAPLLHARLLSQGQRKNLHVHVYRSIAADVAKKEVQRTVLGVVQPGDSIPVPYGWQRAGEGSVRHSCLCLAIP